MHDNLRRVLGFFVYHKKPILGDAFWATMLGVERQIKRGRQCGGPQPGAGKKGVTKVTQSRRGGVEVGDGVSVHIYSTHPHLRVTLFR